LGSSKLGRRASPDAAVQSARAFAVNGEVLPSPLLVLATGVLLL
jgi:hypothetical protein